MDTTCAAARFDQLGHAQAKVRAVDGDQNIRLRLQHRIGGLGNPAFEVKVLRQDFRKAHNAQLFHGELALQPLSRHLGPAYPSKTHARAQGAQTGHQRAAKPVSRWFSRDQEHPHQIVRSRTQRNSPAASQRAIRFS